MSESENPAIKSPTAEGHRPRTNKDWWPDQLDLSVLKKHSARANPMDPDFDYKKEFEKLDVDALKADIVQVLRASMRRPNPGAVYNVADDEPAAPADVVAYACGLLGVEPPPLVALEGAQLSPLARSFYDDNRRVRNDRIKRELGVTLRYPHYRRGLAACLTAAPGS